MEDELPFYWKVVRCKTKAKHLACKVVDDKGYFQYLCKRVEVRLVKASSVIAVIHGRVDYRSGMVDFEFKQDTVYDLAQDFIEAQRRRRNDYD